jgi:hypothetical protein
MTKLKLTSIPDNKPVKITVELTAVVHRDLIVYCELLEKVTSQKIDPAKLVSPMLARFMATDRGFAKARKGNAGATSARAIDTSAKGRPST